MNTWEMKLIGFVAAIIVVGCSVLNGQIVRKVLRADEGGENLLIDAGWRGWGEGFEREGDVFVCDSGSDGNVQRGVSQTVTLNQSKPEAIVATAWSRAEGVGGGRNSDYSLYLDLTYVDGTPLWGQVDTFDIGTHGWEKAEVMIFPTKPVRSLSFHMLLRRHTGKAWFRGARLQVIRPPADTHVFDTLPVTMIQRSGGGFSIRDVASDGDYLGVNDKALGVGFKCTESSRNGARFFDVELTDSSGSDRALSVVYSIRMAANDCTWLEDARRGFPVEEGTEYANTAGFIAGSNGRLSRYPFGAVVSHGKGIALGIDMSQPAFFRVACSGGTRELYMVCDVGLTKEMPTAKLRFCSFNFDAKWGFRAALQRYYEIFSEGFKCKTPRQGLWMPFAKISEVKGWEDFGFAFKEGNNETDWDDEHGIVTFRYTEPMTWWMPMPKDLPRMYDAAIEYAQVLAEKDDSRAKALMTSGYHDERGRFSARIRNTPWCDGAVWSMNSMPGIVGDVTDFKNKWNSRLVDRLYGSGANGVLDGEYIDSSEGYVTDELDYRREHFAAVQTPLTFARKSRKPAIFRGLIVYEYIRTIAADIHARDKLMMANSTPIRLCWLAPMLDVMGTETNWNPGGQWKPMANTELLYRRAMCGAKPYCFLMNTEFERFSHEKVELYMKRALAYGMYPGFFSHNASQGHYFTRPELYERDRGLFKKYVPLCRLIGEEGWEPITRAWSSDKDIYVERFGQRYLTVFNDSGQRRRVTITAEKLGNGRGDELVGGNVIQWKDGCVELVLQPEDVALLELP